MSSTRHAYPPARRADVVDVHHGVAVADPYRWLEDASSAETMAWVDAQNALTRSILDGPERDALVARLTRRFNFPRTTTPSRRGGRYFFTHNSGLQDQPVLYVQDGFGGTARSLLDPNALGGDEGPVALTAIAPNDQGTLVACGLSRSGSDRQEILVRDAATGADRPDRLLWVKFASIAWVPDGTGFYYTRFPEPGSVPDGDEHYFNRVHSHRLGDAQEHDALVFHRPDERETVFGVEVTGDGRWVVITAYQGSSDKSEVYLIERDLPGAQPVPVFRGFASAYTFVDSGGGRLFFQTDDRAPRGRIVAIDPAVPATASEVVPESSDTLESAVVVHGTLVVTYLHNASDQVRMFDLTGRPLGEIQLPGIGSLTGMNGRPEDDELFMGFTSFTQPPTVLRHDFRSGQTTPWLPPFLGGSTNESGSTNDEPELPPEGGSHGVDSSAYTTTQAWYPSKDGTQVSMFLVHKKDLERDGQRPVLLSGYGGFNISLTPSFDPSNFELLDRGGIYGVANLRGGGEYGEDWHQAGMFERKQNVFDDFIAAAEWLVGNGYSRPERIAIEGGSNGGLLTAAVSVQRPELFGAVVCRVPVADMLRYHLFTVGRFWISEYGSADSAEQFPYLYRYSPYHNVRDGAAYPPTLVMTADTDDRVAPGMAKKLAARLQATGSGGPILIRVETKAGHGAGKPVSKLIEEDADIFTFLFKYLDVREP
jgi:prolyl oligopeptidase